MAAVLFGLLSALSLGVADFLASRTSSRIGADRALFGMLVVGAVGLTIYGLSSGAPPPSRLEELLLIFAHGISLAISLLLFFSALALGPVSVVAPIMGANPVLVVAYATAAGRVPGFQEAAAMAAVVGGVVAICAMSREPKPDPHSKSKILRSPRATGRVLALSISASAVYALAIVTGQESAAISNEFDTLWLGRAAGLLLVSALLLLRRRRLAFPTGVRAMVFGHGVLDAAGIAFLLAGGSTANPEYTAVVSSAFCVVTVILACLILRERMSRGQVAGLALIIAGVAMLA